jgi:hypothetical protein
MSSRARTEIAKLEKRYIKSFKLDPSLVKVREFMDDWVVFCPSRLDLPEWSLGYND